MEPTYILDSQLNVFIGDFQEREEKGLDNFWIVKPYNLARSLDTYVTDNLDQIIRLMETGPKVVQKYITSPFLYKGKKIDFRFIVLLKSVFILP